MNKGDNYQWHAGQRQGSRFERKHGVTYGPEPATGAWNPCAGCSSPIYFTGEVWVHANVHTVEGFDGHLATPSRGFALRRHGPDLSHLAAGRTFRDLAIVMAIIILIGLILIGIPVMIAYMHG